MRIKLKLQVVACLFPLLCQAAPAGTFSIKGTLDNLPDSTKLLLVPGNTHKDMKPVATATVLDGAFEFSNLKAEGPRMYYLKLSNANGLFSLVVDNEDVVVNGIAKLTKQGNTFLFKLEHPQVINSKLNDLYLEKRKPFDGLDSLYNAYHVDNEQVFKAYVEARNSKDTAALNIIRQSSAWKKFEDDERHFFQTVETTTQNIILSNKDSWWGPFMMLNTMSYLTDGQKSMYEAFSDEAKNSYYGKIVKEELYPAGFKGKQAPLFTVTDAKGKKILSTELYKGKKYILLDFWASWCAPCRKEIPNLKAQYAKYASKGLEIISISVDQSESDWLKALKEEQLSWPNFRDVSGIASLYGVRAIPSMFLLDEKGSIIEENLRGEPLATKLAGLLN